MSATSVRRHIRAPRAEVYRALLDAQAIAAWRVPVGMSSVVHEFDPRAGGSFRISLTYEAHDAAGKTAGATDTYRGHFASLSPDAQVVEVIEFESANPDLVGPMTVTTILVDADGGTDVLIEFKDIPRGVSTADNELGTRMALDKLAALLEGPPPSDATP